MSGNKERETVRPEKIEERSFSIINEELEAMGICLDAENGPVIRRAIHTTADFDYAENLVFTPDAVKTGIRALEAGAVIVTDTNMARAGINKKKAESLGVEVFCFMADPDVTEEASRRGCTRAAVSMEKSASLFGKDASGMPPVIYAIGNAPTALYALCDLIDEGRIHPALVIGAPVGFVNVVSSKEELIKRQNVPSIVARGRKGGSNVAAAIVNAMLYQAGKPEKEGGTLMDAHGGDVYSRRIRWDFSANVNPLGTPEGVKEAVRRSAEDCCRYPDPRCRRLKKALGAFHQIPEDRILCGNGAADLIFQLALAMRPKQALLLAPTFSEYEKALEAAGCRQELYCLERERDFRPDVRVLEEKIRTMEKEGKKPEILFFCNPNNPTGTAVPKQELEELAEFLEKQKICFALDECFVDFLDHPEAFSLLQETDRFPHMVIFKAFTKLYGMAGLRLGYCVTANQALLKKMEEVRQPWSVSGTAQEAGLAALGESEYREKTKDMIRRGRKQLFEGLSDLGFQVIPPAANYVFFRDVRPEVPEGSLYEECLKRELLIRSCGNYHGLDGRDYRVCVKGEEENRVLLSLLKACRDAGA